MTTLNPTFDASTATATGLLSRRVIEQVVGAKTDQTIAVCIPARDEAATVANVVAAVAELRDLGPPRARAD